MECVWTGVSLNETFEVDHVIPFDLWHNNDSWNLLPASRVANSKKSNKLPSTELLKKRKDNIIFYWEILKNYEQYKFIKEAETLLVITDQNWQDALFRQMAAAVEMTALQCGVGRWP